VKRKTSSAFELATSVLFLSGIQHFAESPDGMQHVPQYVQDYLKSVPVKWEGVKFIDGFPGQYVILARKAGDKWYVAGINASAETKSLQLDLPAFHKSKGSIITDGAEPLTFANEDINAGSAKQVIMKPGGGFVLVLE
jgi:alpha-glucosidase